MGDAYPEVIDFEVDRDNLRRYLCASWFQGWLIAFSCMGSFFGMVSGIEVLESGSVNSIQQIVMTLFIRVLLGAGIGALVATGFYFFLSRSRAKRSAESLSLRVEGAFLCLVQQSAKGVMDHKIHFGALTDFAVLETPRMRRYGIQALVMHTTSCGPAGVLRVEGICDCPKVRDTLADIDRLRE